ncbi:hypothetical protein [Ilumatobacter sp.]|uniref:hypothetical protein n=1 Tax=Ilumatobacter sp. TaxID=1967498 RepID=UPI003751EB97
MSESSGQRPRLDQLIRTGLVATIVLPIIIAVIRSLRTGWFPIGDNALLFLRTRDVWTEHHPLLGSWTSASLSLGENVNNPGSIYDWLIAPWAHLMSPGPAAAVGVATINIACVIGISVVARRVGGWGFERVMLIVTAVLTWSMGSEMLIDIWQANALILPFVLFLLMMLGLSAGDRALIPWTLGVGTLLVQTHVSYAYIFFFLIVGTAAAWVLHNRAADADAGAVAALKQGLRSRTTFAGIGVIAVLWAQPLIEQLFVDGKGNLARLISNSGGGDLSLGPTDAVRIVSAVGVLPPWWGRSGYAETVRVTPLIDDKLLIPGLPSLPLAVLTVVALLVAIVGLTVLSRRAGLHRQAAAGTLVLVAVVGMLMSLSILTIGQVGLSPHHVRWIWPMLAVVHGVLAWLAVTNIHARKPEISWSWATPLAAGLVLATGVANLPFHAQRSGPVAAYDRMPVMREVRPGLDQFALDVAERTPVLFDVSNLVVFEPYSATMMMWLQERDVEFRVNDDVLARQLGPSRVASGTESVRVFQLQGAPAITYNGPACPIAVVSALSDNDEVRAAATLAEVVAASGADRVDVLDGLIDTPSFVSQADSDNLGTWAFTSYGLFADGLPCTD